MCGIVGVIGDRDAAPIILEALKRLEYRGYDSAGLATLHGGAINRRRAAGKLSALTALISSAPIKGHIGIGHTRWATHGAPTQNNAHPHATEWVAVVHNGILENFRDLRTELKAEGYVFTTDTDTETAAHLCTHFLDRGLAPAEAATATLARLKGAFALAFIFRDDPNLMIAARHGAPLAIGYGEGEMFIGSDALALAPMTNRICYLEEGDWACISRDGARIFDAEGRPANRPVKTVPASSAPVDKGEYRHFMAKEIHEQPSVVGHTFARYATTDRAAARSPAPGLDFTAMDQLNIVACGTAYYAGLVAKYWFERIARLPVGVDVASEFRYREPPLPKGGAALFISQSGETADTLAALRYCAVKEQRIISIVNVAESSIARASDVALPTLAGPEIGVASTKAFTCQLTALAATAILAARQRGEINAAREGELIRILSKTPRLLSEAISAEDQWLDIAAEISKARDVLYLGRGAMYPLAMEGALKLKEISYIHAEGYASGELKHGPIALIDETVPVVVMAPRDALFDKIVSNMQEVMARGGKVILITDAEGARIAGDGVWRTAILPAVDPFIAPIIYAAPAQLLAYHTAIMKGTDVDQPRNLAKSVTVE